MSSNVLTVPYETFSVLLEEAITKTGTNRRQVMQQIGYESASVVNAWEGNNATPTRAYMALKGFLNGLNDTRPQFTFDELTALFAVLQGWPISPGVKKSLTRTIMQGINRD